MLLACIGSKRLHLGHANRYPDAPGTGLRRKSACSHHPSAVIVPSDLEQLRFQLESLKFLQQSR